jgi:hypothetical protein
MKVFSQSSFLHYRCIAAVFFSMPEKRGSRFPSRFPRLYWLTLVRDLSLSRMRAVSFARIDSQTDRSHKEINPGTMADVQVFCTRMPQALIRLFQYRVVQKSVRCPSISACDEE